MSSVYKSKKKLAPKAPSGTKTIDKYFRKGRKSSADSDEPIKRPRGRPPLISNTSYAASGKNSGNKGKRKHGSASTKPVPETKKPRKSRGTAVGGSSSGKVAAAGDLGILATPAVGANVGGILGAVSVAPVMTKAMFSSASTIAPRGIADYHVPLKTSKLSNAEVSRRVLSILSTHDPLTLDQLCQKISEEARLMIVATLEVLQVLDLVVPLRVRVHSSHSKDDEDDDANGSSGSKAESSDGLKGIAGAQGAETTTSESEPTSSRNAADGTDGHNSTATSVAENMLNIPTAGAGLGVGAAGVSLMASSFPPLSASAFLPIFGLSHKTESSSVVVGNSSGSGMSSKDGTVGSAGNDENAGSGDSDDTSVIYYSMVSFAKLDTAIPFGELQEQVALMVERAQSAQKRVDELEALTLREDISKQERVSLLKDLIESYASVTPELLSDPLYQVILDHTTVATVTAAAATTTIKSESPAAPAAKKKKSKSIKSKTKSLDSGSCKERGRNAEEGGDEGGGFGEDTEQEHIRDEYDGDGGGGGGGGGITDNSNAEDGSTVDGDDDDDDDDDNDDDEDCGEEGAANDLDGDEDHDDDEGDAHRQSESDRSDGREGANSARNREGVDSLSASDTGSGSGSASAAVSAGAGGADVA